MKKMGKLFNHRYRIASARAYWWNYGWNGAYFITICTLNKEHFFGRIRNKQMELTPAGECARNCWEKIPEHFPFVILGDFVIMPNHVHGIININKIKTNTVANDLSDTGIAIGDDALLENPPGKSKNEFGPQSQNLGSIIRGYKIGVTKFCENNKIPFGWQSRYHDHIIRNNSEYIRISCYIRNNPSNWKKDVHNNK